MKKQVLLQKIKRKFGAYALELFKNDQLWNSIRNNLLELRGSKVWSKSVKELIKKIK